jgi:hypothetical protein
MRHVLGTIFFALTAAVSVSVSLAEGVQVPSAFITGQKYLALSFVDQRTYVTGLLDGIFAGPLLGASEPRVLGLQSCLQDHTNDQIAAILTKYIKDRPERWHEGAHALFYSRMLELCPGVKER